MFVFINYLKAIAACLIVNSHLNSVYPIDFFSFGGGFGLAIFYIVSGYLLVNINKETKFNKWYLKRVIRLYIPLFIINFILLVNNNIGELTFENLFSKFIFPGTWFGASIMLLYLLYYFFVKKIFNKYGNKSIFICQIIIFLIFTILFVFRIPIARFSFSSLSIKSKFSIETPYLITQLIWFSCMLIGLFIRKNQKSLKIQNKLLVIMLFVITLLFFFIKLLTKNGDYLFLQYLLFFIYTGFGSIIFLLFLNLNSKLEKIKNQLLNNTVLLLGSCTLEMLYTQVVIINRYNSLVFPINFIVIIIVILISSYLLHIVSNYIIEKLSKFIKI